MWYHIKDCLPRHMRHASLSTSGGICTEIWKSFLKLLLAIEYAVLSASLLGLYRWTQSCTGYRQIFHVRFSGSQYQLLLFLPGVP